LASCLNEEIPEILETSIFSDQSGPLFTIVDISYDPNGPTRTDVTITFDSVLDGANSAQRDNIIGVSVVGSIFGESILETGVNMFSDRNIRVGQETCYTFTFETAVGGRLQICVLRPSTLY
jgi:hypothetical protein